jgi:hypothetical protein
VLDLACRSGQRPIVGLGEMVEPRHQELSQGRPSTTYSVIAKKPKRTSTFHHGAAGLAHMIGRQARSRYTHRAALRAAVPTTLAPEVDCVASS